MPGGDLDDLLGAGPSPAAPPAMYAPPDVSDGPAEALPQFADAAAPGARSGSLEPEPVAPSAVLAPPPSSAVGPAAPAATYVVGAGDDDEDSFQVGDVVLVKEDFMSDTQETVRLQQGQRGTVEEVDDDGDALIHFSGVEQMQWVSRINFSLLELEAGSAAPRGRASLASASRQAAGAGAGTAFRSSAHEGLSTAPPAAATIGKPGQEGPSEEEEDEEEEEEEGAEHEFLIDPADVEARRGSGGATSSGCAQALDGRELVDRLSERLGVDLSRLHPAAEKLQPALEKLQPALEKLQPVWEQLRPVREKVHEGASRLWALAEPHVQRGVSEFKARSPKEQAAIGAGSGLLLIVLFWLMLPSAAPTTTMTTTMMAEVAEDFDGFEMPRETLPPRTFLRTTPEPTPPPTPTWIRGSYGMGECPAGSSVIRDPHTCELALNSLGKDYQGISTKRPRPPGCHARADYGFFNTAIDEAKGTSSFYPLCQCDEPCELDPPEEPFAKSSSSSSGGSSKSGDHKSSGHKSSGHKSSDHKSSDHKKSSGHKDKGKDKDRRV